MITKEEFVVRRPEQIDFVIVASPFGMIVVPPEEELWIADGGTGVIRVHNVSDQEVRVGLPEAVEPSVQSPDYDLLEPGWAIYGLPARGRLEFVVERPRVLEFEIQIRLESGFRARANSDPRVRIRS